MFIEWAIATAFCSRLQSGFPAEPFTLLCRRFHAELLLCDINQELCIVEGQVAERRYLPADKLRCPGQPRFTAAVTTIEGAAHELCIQYLQALHLCGCDLRFHRSVLTFLFSWSSAFAFLSALFAYLTAKLRAEVGEHARLAAKPHSGMFDQIAASWPLALKWHRSPSPVSLHAGRRRGCRTLQYLCMVIRPAHRGPWQCAGACQKCA